EMQERQRCHCNTRKPGCAAGERRLIGGCTLGAIRTMPRQSAVRTLEEFAAPVAPPDIDYDADYRRLDLPPGASLREIQDRVRLMGAAFQPAGLLGPLMVLARDRAE